MNRRLSRCVPALLALALLPAVPAHGKESPRSLSPAAVVERGVLRVLEILLPAPPRIMAKGGGSMDPNGKPPRQAEPEGTATDGGGSMDPDG
jgi:hypothetical protein